MKYYIALISFCLKLVQYYMLAFSAYLARVGSYLQAGQIAVRIPALAGAHDLDSILRISQERGPGEEQLHQRRIGSRRGDGAGGGPAAGAAALPAEGYSVRRSTVSQTACGAHRDRSQCCKQGVASRVPFLRRSRV